MLTLNFKNTFSAVILITLLMGCESIKSAVGIKQSKVWLEKINFKAAANANDSAPVKIHVVADGRDLDDFHWLIPSETHKAGLGAGSVADKPFERLRLDVHDRRHVEDEVNLPLGLFGIIRADGDKFFMAANEGGNLERGMTGADFAGLVFRLG